MLSTYRQTPLLDTRGNEAPINYYYQPLFVVRSSDRDKRRNGSIGISWRGYEDYRDVRSGASRGLLVIPHRDLQRFSRLIRIGTLIIGEQVQNTGGVQRVYGHFKSHVAEIGSVDGWVHAECGMDDDFGGSGTLDKGGAHIQG